ncbi:alpha/beta hydrolase family protein [Psychroflexus montanilacus]|uniref:alpha/beta hydrolase family protein n=1 Tax=Psychroflexus montanilacus TaxID=2873598 RepID=UPI001CCEB91C|nr:alpha/beta fold hydrolase [Psychroflexus montanilacus]MBZ9652798.1 alpha/beta hydrolase [Psychroflexus montanilacus]
MKATLKPILVLAFLIPVLLTAQSEITAEELNLKNNSILLPGTLTYQKHLDKQPLVIYVHGSGKVDRNGNQAGSVKANYIKQLSEALNENGIAFYRYDKRTATKENMQFYTQGISFLEFVEDLKVAIEHFKDDIRFSDISLIGHSQGSLIGMLAMSEEVDRYVSLAGPASSVDETLTEQYRKQLGDSIAGLMTSQFDELRTTGSIEQVDPIFAQLFSPPNLPFFESWMKYSPLEEIQKVRQPTLIVNGRKDLQVMAEEAEALHQANPQSELVLIDNMNHVLKNIEKDEDNLKSYGTPDFSISEELVTALTKFIKSK